VFNGARSMRYNINKSCLTFSAAAVAIALSQIPSPHRPHDLLPIQCSVDDLVSNNAVVENVLLYYRRRCALNGVNRSRAQSRAPDGSVDSLRYFPPRPLLSHRTLKSPFHSSIRRASKRLYDCDSIYCIYVNKEYALYVHARYDPNRRTPHRKILP